MTRATHPSELKKGHKLIVHDIGYNYVAYFVEQINENKFAIVRNVNSISGYMLESRHYSDYQIDCPGKYNTAVNFIEIDGEISENEIDTMILGDCYVCEEECKSITEKIKLKNKVQ